MNAWVWLQVQSAQLGYCFCSAAMCTHVHVSVLPSSLTTSIPVQTFEKHLAMALKSFMKTLRSGQTPGFPSEANTLEYAKALDAQDELAHLRSQFIIPTKRSLQIKSLKGTPPCTLRAPIKLGELEAND